MGGTIGQVIKDVFDDMREGDQDAKIERLLKLVHILWKEVERLDNAVSAAGHQLTLKVGAASISLKPDGSIAIEGSKITLNGSQSVTIASKNQIDMTGGNIRMTGRNFSVNATGDARVRSEGVLAIEGEGELRLKSNGMILLKGAKIAQN